MNDYDSFKNSCISGDIEEAKKIWFSCSDNINIHRQDDSIFRLSCMNGHMNVVKWLWEISYGEIDTKCLNDDIFVNICARGYRDFAKWLWKIGKNNINITAVKCSFVYAALYGYFDMVQWLYDIHKDSMSPKTMITAFSNACCMGFLDIAIWIHNLNLFGHGYVYDQSKIKKILLDCASKNQVHVIKWICATYKIYWDRECYVVMLCILIHRCDFESIMWFWEHTKCKKENISSNHLSYAFKSGNLNTIKWVLNFNVNIDDCSFKEACENGSVDVAEYFISLKKVDNDDFDIVDTMFHLYSLGHFTMIEWLYEQYMSGRFNATNEEDYYGDSDCGYIGEETKKINFDLLFFCLCRTGNLKNIQHFFDLHNKIDIHYDNNSIFTNACVTGDLRVVEWIWGRASNKSNISSILESHFFKIYETYGSEFYMWSWDKLKKIINIYGKNYEFFKMKPKYDLYKEISKTIPITTNHTAMDTLLRTISGKKYVDENVIKWLYGMTNFSLFGKYIYDIFENFVRAGNLKFSMWLYEIMKNKNIHYFLDFSDIFVDICIDGHIDVAKWIYNIDIEKKYNFSMSDVYTIVNENYKMAFWLYEASIFEFSNICHCVKSMLRNREFCIRNYDKLQYIHALNNNLSIKNTKIFLIKLIKDTLNPPIDTVRDIVSALV